MAFSPLLLAAAAASAAAPAHPGVVGTWMNPTATVEVEARPCGEAVCGRVVWASPQAISDARDGGTPDLIGTELLRDYRPVGSNQWRGTVFVPDMGRTFSSSMVELDRNDLQISGCAVAGFICRKQIWHRQDR